VQVLNEGPLDTELALVHRSEPQGLGTLGQWMAFLAAWLQVAPKWYRFLFFFTRRAKAAEVLRRFGLTVATEATERVARFLTGVRARTLLTEFHHGVLSPGPSEPLTDEALARGLRTHAALFDVLLQLERPALASCRQVVREALRGDASMHARLLAGLRQSAARGEAVARLESRLAEVGLFTPAWRETQGRELRAGTQMQPLLASLTSRLSSVEGLLRIRALVAGLPPALGATADKLALAGAEAENGWRAVRKAVLAAEVSARLRENPVLQHIDADRSHASQTRYWSVRQVFQHKRDQRTGWVDEETG
jgi:hypothetical protein